MYEQCAAHRMRAAAFTRSQHRLQGVSMRIFRTYYSHRHLRTAERKIAALKNSALIKKNKDRRILVVLHLFYPESWKELREYLLNFTGYNWDLYITYPDMIADRIDREDILRLNPGTTFLQMDNKGYDVGPFLTAIKQIDLTSYEAVFKLQSKGVKRIFIYIYHQLFFGRDWFLNLYEGTVGASVIHRTIDRILNEPDVGMVAAKNLIVHDPSYKENLILRKLRETGIRVEKGYNFLAGTCFAIRPSCLQAFKELPFTLDDFVPVPSSQGVSLAHALERYLCIVAEKDGMHIEGNEVMSLRRAVKRPLEKILQGISSERLLKLPYIFDDEYFLWRLDNRFVRYHIHRMPVGDLKYQMGPGEKIIPLKDTYAYRYLQGDRAAYDEYCRIHREKGYPAMTPERFEALIRSLSEQGYDPAHIILVNELGIIRDGQHRACCIADRYGLDYQIDVMGIENIDRIYLAKHMVPRPVLRLYYKKRYGIEPLS